MDLPTPEPEPAPGGPQRRRRWGARPPEDGVREIKVKIPTRLHIGLHAYKLTKGRPISDVVVEALEEWFARHATAGQAAADAERAATAEPEEEPLGPGEERIRMG